MSELRKRWWVFVLIGLVGGLLSGLFGVGGGIVIVPALVAFAGFNRRLAAGTSLAAIVPTSLVGILSYGAGGHVSVLGAAILACGTVVGAQIGTWLLDRLSQQVLRWCFAGFLAVVGVNLLLAVPERGAAPTIGVWEVVALVGVGLVTGILAGLLGVGGGIIVVPALILLFGYSDLLAKGTSLLMMIVTAVSGTIGNLRRDNVDLRSGLLVGLGACLTVPGGTLLATWLDPVTATWLFVAFLAFMLYQTIREALRSRSPSDS